MEKQLTDYLHFYLGCKIEYVLSKMEHTLIGVERDMVYIYGGTNGRHIVSSKNIKPILRHLSDIAEDEQIEADRLMDENRGMAIYRYAERVNYYRSIGIDCDGLIDAGIAIDANTLK